MLGTWPLNYAHSCCLTAILLSVVAIVRIKQHYTVQSQVYLPTLQKMLKIFPIILDIFPMPNRVKLNVFLKFFFCVCVCVCVCVCEEKITWSNASRMRY